MHRILKITLIAALCACRQPAPAGPTEFAAHSKNPNPPGENPWPTIGAIPLPPGFHRIKANPHDFASWLRSVPLKKDRTVYLYNGTPKRNQDAQFAVLDISVGNQDLQQCADAVIRLRAEFLYANRNFINIDFFTEQRVRLNFLEWANGMRFHLLSSRLVPYTLSGDRHYCENRSCFDGYLNTVFTYCGTRSLEQQLVPADYSHIAAGDVLIKGGSPGHAMLVVDAAEDSAGHRIFLLAQSYMPAQDIHIVINPGDGRPSPWYRDDPSESLVETPEWTFTTNQLRTWP